MIKTLVNNRLASVRRRFSSQLKMLLSLILLISLLLIVTINAFEFLPDRLGAIDTNHLYDFADDAIVLNPKQHPHQYVYIDVGCFKGETVEHFIHFNNESALYDIITFEPDPDNYRLCRRALKQKKYAHLNIIILHKVAWIRDGTVSFQTERGSESRINLNGTGRCSLNATISQRNQHVRLASRRR